MNTFAAFAICSLVAVIISNISAAYGNREALIAFKPDFWGLTLALYQRLVHGDRNAFHKRGFHCQSAVARVSDGLRWLLSEYQVLISKNLETKLTDQLSFTLILKLNRGLPDLDQVHQLALLFKRDLDRQSVEER